MSAEIKRDETLQLSDQLQAIRIQSKKSKTLNGSTHTNTTTFSEYLQSLAAFKILSREEEVALGKELEKARNSIIEIFSSHYSLLQRILELPQMLEEREVSARDLFDDYEPSCHQSDSPVSTSTLNRFVDLHSLVSKVKFENQKVLHSKDLKQIQQACHQCCLSFSFYESVIKRYSGLLDVLQKASQQLQRKKDRCSVNDDILQNYVKKLREHQHISWTHAPFSRSTLAQYHFALTHFEEMKRSTEEQIQINLNQLEEIVFQLESAYHLYQRAKDELTQANLKLVVHIVSKFSHSTLEPMDLIQEGNLGLIRAVEKYDYQKGARFMTYATWWIRQAMTRAIVEQGRTIRIPNNVVDRINSLRKASKLLEQELGRTPTAHEISFKMGLPLSRVEKLIMISQNPKSLNEPIEQDDGETEFGDLIQDTYTLTPEEEFCQNHMKDIADELLNTLSPREEKIIRMRFGIGENSHHTLEDIAHNFNLSRERIRQLECQALKKLKHRSRLI